MPPRLSGRFLLIAALVCAFWQTLSWAGQWSTTAGAGDSDALFDGSRLHDIWLQINARDWDDLRANYRENTYYPADLEWRGLKVRNVGVRVRGRTSRNPNKPALRIDFNHYVSGQEFLGLKSLSLDNLWQDPSMMRERLAMEVFSRMHVPAPREAHARLFIGASREFAGVYGVVESIDKAFLARTLGEKDGYLYEYQWQEPYGFEAASASLDWYATRFEARTHERDSTFALYAPLRDLVDAINGAPVDSLDSIVEPHIDLASYITHIAVENVLSNPDGLLGGLGMNNFYLYRSETGRSQLIPWDQDLAFEHLETPTPEHNVGSNVLAQKIWESPRLRAVYLRELLRVADLIGPAAGAPAVSDPSRRLCPPAAGAPPCSWLEEEVGRLYTQLRSAAHSDRFSPHPPERFEEAVALLQQFARQRSTVVREYVGRVSPELVSASPTSR